MYWYIGQVLTKTRSKITDRTEVTKLVLGDPFQHWPSVVHCITACLFSICTIVASYSWTEWWQWAWNTQPAVSDRANQPGWLPSHCWNGWQELQSRWVFGDQYLVVVVLVLLLWWQKSKKQLKTYMPRTDQNVAINQVWSLMSGLFTYWSCIHGNRISWFYNLIIVFHYGGPSLMVMLKELENRKDQHVLFLNRNGFPAV